MEEFTRGEIIEVRDHDELDFVKRIYLATIHGAHDPFVCVLRTREDAFNAGMPFTHASYRYARKRRPDLKVDDRVMVRDVGGPWIREHFAGWADDGRVEAFVNGKTSWTVPDGMLELWDEYKLPEVPE